MASEATIAANPVATLSYWEVRFTVCSAQIPLRLAVSKNIKFVGLYTDLEAATQKCKDLLMDSGNTIDEWMKDKPRDSSLHCCISRESVTMSQAYENIRSVEGMETKHQIDPEIFLFAVCGKIIGETTFSHHENSNFPLEVWEVKWYLALGEDGHQEVTWMEESFGIYLNPGAADRKLFELMGKAIQRGWKTRTTMGNLAQQDGPRRIWVVGKDKDGRILRGEIEKIDTSNSTGISKMVEAEKGTNSTNQFPLAAWQVVLSDWITPYDAESVPGEIQGTYASKIEAIDHASDLLYKHYNLGLTIAGGRSQGKAVAFGSDVGLQYGWIRVGSEEDVLIWLGDLELLETKAFKLCYVLKIALADGKEAEHLQL